MYEICSNKLVSPKSHVNEHLKQPALPMASIVARQRLATRKEKVDRFQWEVENFVHRNVKDDTQGITT